MYDAIADYIVTHLYDIPIVMLILINVADADKRYFLQTVI